jgi:hypothetical protein
MVKPTIVTVGHPLVGGSPEGAPSMRDVPLGTMQHGGGVGAAVLRAQVRLSGPGACLVLVCALRC